MTTCWKQPTPTDINHMQEFDALDRAIFREILSLCQNKNTVINFIQSDKHYSVELNRGQCIFKVSKFAKEMKIDPKRVRKNIEKLSKWYSQMDSKAMPFGLVITMINYDDLVKMESQMDNDGIVKGESKDSQRRANKSVESDIDVKSEEIKNISKDISTKVAYGNEFINELCSFMQDTLELPKLNGTIKNNRNQAYVLLNEIKKTYNVDDVEATRKIKMIIRMIPIDTFWNGKINDFTALKRNWVNLVKKLKEEKQNAKSKFAKVE